MEKSIIIKDAFFVVFLIFFHGHLADHGKNPEKFRYISRMFQLPNKCSRVAMEKGFSPENQSIPHFMKRASLNKKSIDYLSFIRLHGLAKVGSYPHELFLGPKRYFLNLRTYVVKFESTLLWE